MATLIHSKSRSSLSTVLLVCLLLLTTVVRFPAAYPLVDSTTSEVETWPLPEEYEEFGMRLSKRMDAAHSLHLNAPDGGLLITAAHQRPKVESNRVRDARNTPLVELRNRILRNREKVASIITTTTSVLTNETQPNNNLPALEYVENHEDLENHASELVPLLFGSSSPASSTIPVTHATTTVPPPLSALATTTSIAPAETSTLASTLSPNNHSASNTLTATKGTRIRPITLTRSPFHRPLPVVIKAADEAVSRVQHTEILRESTRAESLLRLNVPPAALLNSTATGHPLLEQPETGVPLAGDVHGSLGVVSNDTKYVHNFRETAQAILIRTTARPNLTPIRRIRLRVPLNTTEAGAANHSSKASASTSTTVAPSTALPIHPITQHRNFTSVWSTKKEVIKGFSPLQKEQDNSTKILTTGATSIEVPPAVIPVGTVADTKAASYPSVVRPANQNQTWEKSSFRPLVPKDEISESLRPVDEKNRVNLAPMEFIEASRTTRAPEATTSLLSVAQLVTTPLFPSILHRLTNSSSYTTLSRLLSSKSPITYSSTMSALQGLKPATTMMAVTPPMTPQFAVSPITPTVVAISATPVYNVSLRPEIALIPFTIEDAMQPVQRYETQKNLSAGTLTVTDSPASRNRSIEGVQVSVIRQPDQLSAAEPEENKASMVSQDLPSLFTLYPYNIESQIIKASPTVTQASLEVQETRPTHDNAGKSSLTSTELSTLSTKLVTSAPSTTSRRPVAIEDILNIQNMMGTETNVFLRPKPTLVGVEMSTTTPSSSRNAVIKESILLQSPEQPEPVQVKENEPVTQQSTSIYIIGVVGIVPVAGALAWLIKVQLRRRRQRLSESDSSSESEFPKGRQSSVFTAPVPITTGKAHRFSHGASDKEDLMPHIAHNSKSSPWEFPRSQVKLQTLVGEGYFGQVWKAEAEAICGYQGTLLVAVKMVKDGASHKEKQELLKEMNIMQQMGPHPNVVALVGCCTEQEPFLLIMEYVMFGRLLTFLRDHRTQQRYYNFSRDAEALTSRDLTTFAYCVAKGMEYIASKGIVHRDLAARNILVDHNKMCKVADFGMSRNVKDTTGEMYEQRVKGALPIRWMAPESLVHSVFTQKSDVWSFGVLLWEIVTLGSTPYPGMEAREVMRKVRDGHKPDRPSHCRHELYRLMQKCWCSDPLRRPDFSELRSDLAHLLDDGRGYVDLDKYQDDAYMNLEPPSDESEKV